MAIPFVDAMTWFGERTVPTVLFSLAVAFASFAVSLRETDGQTWTPPVFIAALSFSAVLVAAGCAERIVMIRARRTRPIYKEPAPRTWLNDYKAQTAQSDRPATSSLDSPAVDESKVA